MRLLNIGCGALVHPEWINLDVTSSLPGVIRHDIRKGLPFEDASIDACYSSHMVEHLRREDAVRLLTECRRVLKPGGVVRIVVPDLEAITLGYLDALRRVRQGEPQARREL